MKKYRQFIAGVLAVIISAAATGSLAYAKNIDSNEDESAVTAELIDTSAAEQAAPASDTKAEKDETVYVIAKANGEIEKVIVSDWLQNNANAESLTDASDLDQVKNVKSDAGYTVNGDGAMVWDAKGSDLYYQGESKQKLPVDLSVSYKLNGKKISAEELAGKSGKVTIRFDYKNRQYETVEIDGKKEKIYVPFVMLTGMALDQARFHNVEITNGRIISDGNRIFAAGYAMPGMQETLALDKKDFEIPDYVEITADVTDFKLGMTVTFAANDLFSQIDTDNLKSPEDLEKAADQLTDAMEQLTDGSTKLYDGLDTLLNKSGDLKDGINRLADGAKTLKNGTVSLADGAGTLQNGTVSLANGAGALKNGTAELSSGAQQLQSGAAQLSDGLQTLHANSASLNGGAKQVFEALLQTAQTQIAAAGLEIPALTIENYADVLTAQITALDKDAVYQTALDTVTAAVEAHRSAIREQVTAAVRAQVQENVAAAVKTQVEAAVAEQVRANIAQIRAAVIQQAANMSAEEYDAAVAAGLIPAAQQTAINAAIEQTVQSKIAEQTESAAVQAQIAALTEQNTAQQMTGADVQEIIAQNTEAQVQQAIAAQMAGETVQEKLQAASAGAQSLIALKTQLDSYRAFYLGLQQYTAGVDQAAEGAAALNAGVAQLCDGAARLDSGAADLQSGAAQVQSGAQRLQSGAAQLQGGAAQLCDGILTLQDGVPALTDGVTKLRDGSEKLTDGLEQFDKDGVQKITKLLDGDLSGLLTRLRAVSDVSKDYRSFSGISDNMRGKVRFVYRTEEIK